MTDENRAQAVLATITERRSLRRYRPEPVPEAILRMVLDAGIRAPSAHNRQPWRFALVSRESRDKLAKAMGARLRADLEADHVPEVVIAQDVNRSYERITLAPVLIVLCLSMADMDHYPDQRRQENERIMAIQSTAMAGQNLLLAAHALGLGACWMCAPLFVPDIVRDTLELPPDWEPQGMITMGFTDQERTKNRAALETRILWR